MEAKFISVEANDPISTIQWIFQLIDQISSSPVALFAALAFGWLAISPVIAKWL